MNLNIYQYYDNFGGATILISLAIMFIAGFILSRITKLLHLPNVTGYILSGILIGPFVLNLISPTIISEMSFLSDLALGFIAFGVGKFFKKEVLKSAGWNIILITLMEALLAGILVTIFVGVCFPSLGWPFALLLGAIATATAPASTLMTINQYKAKGEFVETLLQVVALDDVVCLLIFTIVSSIVQGLEQGSVDALQVLLPIIYNLSFILLGFVAGFLLKFLVKGRSPNSRLIIAVALIAAISGACILLDISPLLSCMVFGASYINFAHDEKLFTYVDHFDPPIMLLFFVLSGMNMDFSSFATIGLVGVVYFLIRLVGKYGGAYLGCLATKKEKKTKIYLGFALAPQAGVAIGLGFLGQRMLPSSIGDTFLSIILCSSVLYEMAGPILAKVALIKTGAIPAEAFKKKEKPQPTTRVIDCLPLDFSEMNDSQQPNLETNHEPDLHAPMAHDWRRGRRGGFSYTVARHPNDDNPS